MKFNISSAIGREPPCGGAVLVGENRFGEKLYEIEINNLDDLLQLAEIDRNGIVVCRSDHIFKNNNEWEIIIYDGYIE